jgi:hypothetical protein
LLVSQDVTYILIFFSGLIFTLLTFLDEVPDIEEDYKPSVTNYMAVLVRRPVFSLIGAISWAVFGGMSFSLNNCDTNVGACFTTSYETATTSTVYANPFGVALGWFGYGMFLLMLVFTILFMFLTAYSVMRYGSIAGIRSRRS